MANVTPDNSMVWFEIPVTDMKRAKAFYDAVFLTELQEDNTGPNPMAMFPIKDMKTGNSGHLYPGKAGLRWQRQHGPPRRAGAARGRARARRKRTAGKVVSRNRQNPAGPLRLLPRSRREQHRRLRAPLIRTPMRRADRLFQIVQHLRGGRLVTARTLSERLEVSERTIYRDVADLMASGVPIDGEAGVGYILRSGYDLPPLMFTRDELAALTLGARFVKAWGGARLALAAEEALVKIEAVLPEKERRAGVETNLFAMSFSLPDEVRRVVDHLDVAIRDRRRVHIVYDALDGGGERAGPAPPRPLSLGQGVDARRLVRAAHRLPQFPRRPDHDDRRLRRHVSRRAGTDAA